MQKNSVRMQKLDEMDLWRLRMDNKILKTALILGVTLVAGISCGKGTGGTKVGSELNTSLAQSSLLDQADFETAAIVCSSLRFKRLNFSNIFADSEFKFAIMAQNCDWESLASYTVSEQWTDSAFTSAETRPYYASVETDTSGEFSKICEKVFNGVVPSNRESVGLNTVRQFSFKTLSTGNILVDIVYGKRESSTSDYLSYKTVAMTIDVDTNKTPSYQGMVIVVESKESCSSTSLAKYKILNSYLK